ncbi:uncharacterized protein CFAP97D2 isoform X2 [Hydra vulgaris]|uniref:Uncharacterized protein CFAP97D2 isoform X2 n=1 Tax=Hydra vulgaris TaxID=6087 RepID=A0ABM4B7C2_HYDVU
MHRAYQPITPAHNKLLKKRWDMTKYDIHRKKVYLARPVIDNHPPKTYAHLQCKLKKMQIEEEHLATVQRDNMILYHKMSFIEKTKGSVDNRNEYEHKSLNQSKRQRELHRVNHENQAIIKRIVAKQPFYSHLDFEEDWRTNQQFMDNIAKYPRDVIKDTKSRNDDSLDSKPVDLPGFLPSLITIPSCKRMH